MDDIDHVMDVLNSLEEKNRRERSSPEGRTEIGRVEHFYDKINVAAIRLTSSLSVGDTIEIEHEEYSVKQKVTSMQIDRKDVPSASAGDDVGIKLRVPVPRGSIVFRLG